MCTHDKLFVIKKSVGDETIAYYKESDFFKEYQTHGLIKDTELTVEHYHEVNTIFEHWIRYCYNSLPPFVRAEKCYEEHHDSLLYPLSKTSSILDKNEQGTRRIDIYCPKVAWGFTAFLMAHTTIDKKGRPRHSIHDKEVNVSVLMEEYLSSQKTNYNIQNEDDYKYNSINGLDDENRTLDITFYESHIKQENDLISRTEQKGNNIAKGFISYSIGYIQFAEQEMNKLKVVNFSNTETTKLNNDNSSQYSKELLDLFHNHTELIDELIGLPNNKIALKIREWTKKRDSCSNKSLIENPNNNLKSKFARELIKAKIVTCHEKTFRNYL